VKYYIVKLLSDGKSSVVRLQLLFQHIAFII
jgi:hypothetical protein